ncbi:helix-turn-helix domain-containing protein [Leptolyngbya sp. AN02str]
MNFPSSPDAATDSSLILSSQNQGWRNLLVEQFREPPGEGNCHHSHEHTICLALDTRPIRMLQIREGKTYTGLYAKGDLSITPAQMPLFACWDGEDHHLKIRLTSHFIQQIAREALGMDSDRLELLPQARIRDPHIEAIGLMLLAELQQGNTANTLYVESLANVLAVHLIRQHTTDRPQPVMYEGGLPQRQLLQVLDYIDAHLQQEIKLTDLASLVGMSEFHFGRQFKQGLGTTPHQYLLQQRIERAKQLLKQSDRSISDIALTCGFNSHSHLSKQFRQLTGTTPKAYRLNS